MLIIVSNIIIDIVRYIKGKYLKLKTYSNVHLTIVKVNRNVLILEFLILFFFYRHNQF